MINKIENQVFQEKDMLMVNPREKRLSLQEEKMKQEGFHNQAYQKKNCFYMRMKEKTENIKYSDFFGNNWATNLLVCGFQFAGFVVELFIRLHME